MCHAQTQAPINNYYTTLTTAAGSVRQTSPVVRSDCSESGQITTAFEGFSPIFYLLEYSFRLWYVLQTEADPGRHACPTCAGERVQVLEPSPVRTGVLAGITGVGGCQCATATR